MQEQANDTKVGTVVDPKIDSEEQVMQEQANDTKVGIVVPKIDSEEYINKHKPYRWEFLLEHELGRDVVKRVISIVNRGQAIDMWEEYDYGNSEAIKLAEDIAEVVRDVGHLLGDMSSVDEVLHVGELIVAYAHAIEIAINHKSDDAANWAVRMLFDIKKSEQTIRFIKTEGITDFWNCTVCEREFMTEKLDGDDVSSRYCPYCGEFQANIIKAQYC